MNRRTHRAQSHRDRVRNGQAPTFGNPGSNLVRFIGDLTLIPDDRRNAPFSNAEIMAWYDFCLKPALVAKNLVWTGQQFGLITSPEAGRYKLTEDAHELLVEGGYGKRVDLLHRVALNPPLFEAMYRRFGWTPRSARCVVNYLTNLRFTQSEAEEIRDHYWRTGLFAQDPDRFGENLCNTLINLARTVRRG